MHTFIIQIDPMTGEKYINVPLRQQQLVEHPIYNKGSAFSAVEREQLGLQGLFPRHQSSMKEQLCRVYDNYSLKKTSIEKFIFLQSLLDRNETLFYRLLLTHAEEMLPIVYTPTVGEAAKTYSHMFRRPRGLYIPADKISQIDTLLDNAQFSNISLIVVTDGERILGLGDQGVGGMAIPVGKISLYVVGAGIPPALCLPILLDMGTNNEELLNDPLYLGVRHRRLTGDRYDEVIEAFVNGVKRHFPQALLQWEDFGKHHALRLLKRYQNRLCSFDDDIQGTGAVTVAALYSAMARKKEKLKDQRYVFFGFGQAGYGIASLLINALIEEGLSIQEAKECIYPVGHNGLVFDDMNPHEYQAPFACSRTPNWSSGRVDLFETIVHTKATVLIGTSGLFAAFTEQVLSQMAQNTEKPVIFALSNPNNKCECTPEQAIQATQGKCLIATGSPFSPVILNKTEYTISQCNNMYIFPGVGLGAIVSMTPKITDQMFVVAAKTLASMVDSKQQALLPEIHEMRTVAENVAFAVAQCARDTGLGRRLSDDKLRIAIQHAMWQPEYLAYRSQYSKV